MNTRVIRATAQGLVHAGTLVRYTAAVVTEALDTMSEILTEYAEGKDLQRGTAAPVDRLNMLYLVQRQREVYGMGIRRSAVWSQLP